MDTFDNMPLDPEQDGVFRPAQLGGVPGMILGATIATGIALAVTSAMFDDQGKSSSAVAPARSPRPPRKHPGA